VLVLSRGIKAVRFNGNAMLDRGSGQRGSARDDEIFGGPTTSGRPRRRPNARQSSQQADMGRPARMCFFSLKFLSFIIVLRKPVRPVTSRTSLRIQAVTA